MSDASAPASSVNEPIIVGLMGPFGYGNLGDAATQDAMIQHLRRRIPSVDLRGFSLDPADTKKRHGIESFPISRQSSRPDDASPDGRYAAVAAWIGRRSFSGARSLQRVLLRLPIEGKLIASARKSLSGVKLLIISGGGQIEDYWGGGGPWSYPYTLLKWCIIAKLIGAKIAVVSVGAGPINSGLSARFLRWALKLSDYRSFRDTFSQSLVRSIGLTRDDGVFPDLAFSLEQPQECVSPLETAGRRRIAIGPIGFMKPGFWPREKEELYEDYAKKLVMFIRFLLDRGDTVVFVPGEAHYDRLIIDDIVKRLDLTALEAERVEQPAIETVTDLLAQLSKVNLVVASRFHNLVMAHMLGKPTIALSYQEKIDCLMQAAELPEYCFHLSDFDVQTLKERIALLEAEAEAIRAKLLLQCEHNRSKLLSQYDQVLRLLNLKPAIKSGPSCRTQVVGG
jgi:polysaccharide pyruvyl transferase WcaK-like protein